MARDSSPASARAVTTPSPIVNVNPETERGEVIFKADLSVLSPLGGQVEGVYTAEDRRGRGIAGRCMTEIGRRLLETLPMLTLHVAADNTPALRAYEKAGYRRQAELRLAIYPYVR